MTEVARQRSIDLRQNPRREAHLLLYSANTLALTMETRGRYKTSPIVGYIRSAKPHDPQLAEWEQQIRAYAIVHGYNLVAVFREESTSGVAAHRPVLDSVLRDLSTGRYAGILVPSESHISSDRSKRRRIIGNIEKHAWIITVTNP